MFKPTLEGIIIDKVRDSNWRHRHKYEIMVENGATFKVWADDIWVVRDIYKSYRIGINVEVVPIRRKFLFFEWTEYKVIKWIAK